MDSILRITVRATRALTSTFTEMLGGYDKLTESFASFVKG
jgi:hypothetical protein